MAEKELNKILIQNQKITWGGSVKDTKSKVITNNKKVTIEHFNHRMKK